MAESSIDVSIATIENIIDELKRNVSRMHDDRIEFTQYNRRANAFTGMETAAVDRFGGNSMQIKMRFLWHYEDDCLDSLHQDGWVILAGQGDREIEVSHPQVTTEDAARIRLHRLGLLTSRALRIEFWPSCQIFTQQK